MGASKIPFRAFSENFRSQKPPLQTKLINSLMESNTFFFFQYKSACFDLYFKIHSTN